MVFKAVKYDDISWKEHERLEKKFSKWLKKLKKKSGMTDEETAKLADEYEQEPDEESQEPHLKEEEEESQSMSTKYIETKLLGVPHYLQGNADGLCIYYAMSMVLEALYPDFHGRINEPPHHRKEGDPVFRILRKRAKNDRKFKEKLGKWFFNGMTMTEATRTLNEVFREHYKDPRATKYFIHGSVNLKRMKKQKDNRPFFSFTSIRNALTWHLPVIIAGGGIQNHAVVAVGWGSEGNFRWIIFQDPANVHERRADVRDIFYGNCEAIVPDWNLFMVHRPPVINTRDRHTKYEEWKPELWQK